METILRDLRVGEENVGIIGDNFEIGGDFLVSLDHHLCGVVQKGVFEIPSFGIDILLLQETFQVFNRVIIRCDQVLLHFHLHWTNIIELFHCRVNLPAHMSCSNRIYEILLLNLLFQTYFLLKSLYRLNLVLKSPCFLLNVPFYNFNQLLVLLAQNCIIVCDLDDHNDFG